MHQPRDQSWEQVFRGVLANPDRTHLLNSLNALQHVAPPERRAEIEATYRRVALLPPGNALIGAIGLSAQVYEPVPPWWRRLLARLR